MQKVLLSLLILGLFTQNNLKAQYCVPNVTCGKFIDKVQVELNAGSIFTYSDNSCTAGYADYTSVDTIELEAGQSYVVKVSKSFTASTYNGVTPGTNGYDGFVVWGDFDISQSFDLSEAVFQKANVAEINIGPVNATTTDLVVHVPADAKAGLSRLRVKSCIIYDGDVMDDVYACNGSKGEVEDYLINITNNNNLIPPCPTNPSPTDGQTNVCNYGGVLRFSPPPAETNPLKNPSGYVLSVWKDSGSIQYLDRDTNIGTDTSYVMPYMFNPGDTIYWTVNPYNETGDTNRTCAPWYFVTAPDAHPAPIIEVDGADVRQVDVCHEVDAFFTLNDANGSTYYNPMYDWNGTLINKFPLSDTLIANPVFNSNISDTTFLLSISVIDGHGCMATDSVDVYVKDPADAGTINSQGGTKICEGDITQLDVSNNVGNVAWWYSYTSASSNLNNTGETSNVYSTDPILSDVYFIVIADNNGCVDSTSIFIEKNDLPIPPFVTAASNSFCDGDSVMLTANWPGTGAVTKVWDDANSTVGDNLWVYDSGTFITTVTDQNGCSNSSVGFGVTKNELPNNPSLLESGGNCDGDTTFLQVGVENAQSTELISGIMFSQDSIFNLTIDTTLQFVNHSAEGCLSDTVAYSITFDETPEKPVVDTITYKHVFITNPNGVEFYWYNEQGDLIATEVDSNFYPTESGKYVVVQSLGPCLSEPSDTIMVDLTIGINDLGRMPRIEVYPNPSNGQVFISAEDNGTLVVVDMLGSQIMQRELKKGKNEITIDNAGIFILMVEIKGKQIWQQKMVIE